MKFSLDAVRAHLKQQK